MRIIAGQKKGLKLLSPPGLDTRPITDRVKEAIFNILAHKGLLEGSVVADLFCGTGSLGLEALSRGATWVSFFDSNRKVIDILKKNVQRAGFENMCKCVAANVFSIGAALPPHYAFYDLVFIDPPYRFSENALLGSRMAALMELISESMRPGGWALLRTSSHAAFENAYGELCQIDLRTWGTMKVSFYQKGLDEQI